MLKIGIGSKTSTGGAVVEGNPGVLFDGLIATSVGQQATCPACKKGIGNIVAVGPRTVMLPAGPAARAGDYVACGCPAGSNVLLPDGSIHIGSQSGAKAIATGVTAIAAPSALKQVKKIFWSFSDAETPLDSVSRFYVDVNLHAETSGYQPGETVEFELEGATEGTVTGTVGEDGMVFIPRVLKNQPLELQGVM